MLAHASCGDAGCVPVTLPGTVQLERARHAAWCRGVLGHVRRVIQCASTRCVGIRGPTHQSRTQGRCFGVGAIQAGHGGGGCEACGVLQTQRARAVGGLRWRRGLLRGARGGLRVASTCVRRRLASVSAGRRVERARVGVAAVSAAPSGSLDGKSGCTGGARWVGRWRYGLRGMGDGDRGGRCGRSASSFSAGAGANALFALVGVRRRLALPFASRCVGRGRGRGA
jgi:hypothetical protein